MRTSFSNVALYFVILLWSNAFTSATMVIPASFSAAHKTTYLQDDTPIVSVLKVLSSFEVDSHIEVVLIGDAFTQTILNELSSSLKVLSDLAAAASPLKFIHEQLVYHVSMGVGLESKIRQRIELNAASVPVDLIGEVLQEFHSHAATPTTIFVLHSGSLNSHAYKAKLSSCPQRTFLAKEGFALIDLSARATTIRSTANGNDHIISETEFSFLDSDKVKQGSSAMHTSIHDLATLIHRSGEAVVPFPIFSSDTALLGDTSASTGRVDGEMQELDHTQMPHYVDEAAPVKDESLVEIVVFTLCMSGANCEDDKDTKHAVENLLSGLSGDTHNINLSTFHLSADTDPQIAHAVHSATSYSAQGSTNILKLSSKELLFWLGSSLAVRNVLSKQGRYYMKYTEFKKRIIPLFVIQLPGGAEILLDDGKQVAAQSFPEPAGGWLTDAEDAAAMFSLHRQRVFEADWPSSAVVAVVPSGGQILTVPTGLECGGYAVPRGQADYVGELLEVLQAAVWGILPTHTHYSSSSRGLVQDYLWSVPTSIRLLLDQKNPTSQQASWDFTFPQTRQIHRHSVIHSSDRVIGAFSDILLDAASIRPAVNISSILGLQEHKPRGNSNSFASSYNPFASNTVTQKDILRKTGGGKVQVSLFEKFLNHLDAAAISFSHLEYSAAQNHLKNANKVQKELKDLVETLLNMRTGSYTCKDMRKETKLELLANKKEGLETKEIKHEKGHFEKKHEERRRWTWVFGIFGSILIGCLVGYDVAVSKNKRALQ